MRMKTTSDGDNVETIIVIVINNNSCVLVIKIKVAQNTDGVNSKLVARYSKTFLTCNWFSPLQHATATSRPFL